MPVPPGNVTTGPLRQYALFRKVRLGVGIAFTTTVLVAVTEQLSGVEVVVTETVWVPTPKVAGLKEVIVVPPIEKVLPVTEVKDTAGAFTQYAVPNGPKFTTGTGLTLTVCDLVPVQVVRALVLVTTTVWFPGPKVAGLKLVAATPLMVKVLPVMEAAKVTAASLAQYSAFRPTKVGAGSALTVTVLVTLEAQPAGVVSLITTVCVPTPKVAGLKVVALVFVPTE